MAEVIRMPRLSDTMEEGNIVAWLKKVGDKVSPGDILAEVETDKATMELESFHEGYLLYISVPQGPVPVNEILAVIGEKDEDYKSLIDGSGNGKAAPAKDGSKETAAPKEEAEQVEEEEPEQAEEKEEADEAATPEAKPKKEVPAKSPEEKEDKETSPSENKGAEGGAQPAGERIKSSPLAKSIAAKAGVDISGIKGSGDGGRIIKRDVEQLVAGGKQAKSATPAQQVSAGSEDVPLSQMRKTIAKRLVESKFSAPHYYLTMKINMDKVADARKMINDQTGLKISFNDFIIKACAAALKQHPAINSSWMGDKIRINRDINIGVAVAVDEGLLVPVLFNTPGMSLSMISEQVNALAEKARQKKLQPQEMQGNTFTVSNLGMFGIDEFTAIINPPDAAIMAVGAITEELKMAEGQVRVEKVMKITLSCDHRVIDGATGSKFLQTFRQLLENPVAMLV